MKTKNIKYILGIFILGSMFALTGCNKYLSVTPDNRTDLNTVDKIREVLTSAYCRASWISIAEVMSDNVTDKGIVPIMANFNVEQHYRYLDNQNVNRDTPTFFWTDSYRAISAANHALEAISKMPNPENLKSEKAEALLCRAYAHFMLVTLFAKPYNESTSSSDMGVPYVTEVENVVVKKYARTPVKEVYDLIQKDIEEALPFIDDSRYKVPKYHFTVASANAFAARFYLFKKDYQKAVEHANKVLPINYDGSSLRPWLTTFRGTSNEIMIDYTKATLPSNLLLIESASLWARLYARDRFGGTDGLIQRSILPITNVVGNPSWAYRVFVLGIGNPFVPKWNEFFYTPTPDPTFGIAHVMSPQFTLEEVLFNRAEANVYLDKYSDALRDLNVFARNRFLNYRANHVLTESKVADFYQLPQKEAFVRAVLDLKRAEFVHEGIRWLDILRYDIPVSHEIKDLGSTVVETIELPAGDLRRQWQLPESVSASGIQRNPR